MHSELSNRYRRLLTASGIGTAFLGILVTAAMHAPIALQPVLVRFAGAPTQQHPMPIRRIDPTARLRGWRHLSAEVDRLRSAMGDAIIVGERWTIASELGFYLDGRPNVYCIGLAMGDRHSQYDLWRPNPIADESVFRGRSFILINVDPAKVADAFDRMEPVHRVEYREAGTLVAVWTIHVAHGFRGFAARAERSY